MNLAQKIIGGDEMHKSRFHDQKRNLIDLQGLRYFPHCISSTVLRLTIGKRPVLPWIGYRAINRLKKILNNKTKMIEFGSGMSTIWYAKHCGEVISIEDNELWYNKISRELRDQKFTNVSYHLKKVPDYCELYDV